METRAVFKVKSKFLIKNIVQVEDEGKVIYSKMKMMLMLMIMFVMATPGNKKMLFSFMAFFSFVFIKYTNDF